MTDRQSAILELVASGLENKEIAHRLGISEQAVKEHVSNLLRALAAPNRAALGEAAATRRFVGTAEFDPDWLRFLFQEAPMHVAVVVGPEHRFIAVNEAFRRSNAGVEVVGMAYRDAFPDRAESLAVLDRVLASGERIVANSLARHFVPVGETEFQDGFVTFVLQPLPGPDGAAIGVAIFSIDVTEQVRANEVARQRADEQQAILAQLPSGVLVVDRSGVILELNESGRRILPFEPDGKTKPWEIVELRDLKTGGPLSSEQRPLLRALQGKTSPEADYLGVNALSGDRIALRISAAPLFADDRSVRGAIAVFTEISPAR